MFVLQNIIIHSVWQLDIIIIDRIINGHLFYHHSWLFVILFSCWPRFMQFSCLTLFIYILSNYIDFFIFINPCFKFWWHHQHSLWKNHIMWWHQSPNLHSSISIQYCISETYYFDAAKRKIQPSLFVKLMVRYGVWLMWWKIF